MKDITKVLQSMPPIGSMITIYGEEVKVIGFRIMTDAAYVIYDDGSRLEHVVHSASISRIEKESADH